MKYSVSVTEKIRGLHGVSINLDRCDEIGRLASRIESSLSRFGVEFQDAAADILLADDAEARAWCHGNCLGSHLLARTVEADEDDGTEIDLPEKPTVLLNIERLVSTCPSSNDLIRELVTTLAHELVHVWQFFKSTGFLSPLEAYDTDPLLVYPFKDYLSAREAQAEARLTGLDPHGRILSPFDWSDFGSAEEREAETLGRFVARTVDIAPLRQIFYKSAVSRDARQTPSLV